jgi:hypothetical protein
MTLVKVLEHLLALAFNDMILEVAHTCFQSLLDATSRLKEVQEAEGSEEDEDNAENDDEEDDEESDEDDEVDYKLHFKVELKVSCNCVILRFWLYPNH